MKGPLAPGHYAQKQCHSRNPLLAWSHSARYKTARRLVARQAGGRLLDYGCGDGTFLELVADLFPQAVGADVDARSLLACTARFAALPGISFVATDALGAAHDGRFDVITCMEVLEHLVEETLERVLADLGRLLAPEGRLIVSVPIEIGPPLIAKQVTRRLLGWLGRSDYAATERYTPGEMLTMLFAGSGSTIARVPHDAGFSVERPTPSYGHKGFNWRALAARLRRDFAVERTLFSPIDLAGGAFASQAWLVCRRRSG